MRAVVTETYGAAPVVREIPDPVPGQGEVLVRIAASSLNPFDRFVASGGLKDRMEHRFPVILGRDYAGTIEALGEGTEGFAVGDRVFGTVASPFLGPGALAERIAAPAAYSMANVPPSLDLEAAAALGLAGSTALPAVNAIDPQPGETVLISGATGGLGSLATQLVAARGATVIATARSEEGQAFVRDLGATHVVDWTGDVLAQTRAIAPDGVHAIIHLAGDGVALADLLVPGGRIVSTLGVGPENFEGRDVKAIRGSADPATLSVVAELAAKGALKVPIGRRYTLDDVPGVFAAWPPALGKSVVRIG
jgi:NADPH2:quinone reductase